MFELRTNLLHFHGFFEFCGNDFVSEYLKISPVAIVDIQKVNTFVIREEKKTSWRSIFSQRGLIEINSEQLNLNKRLLQEIRHWRSVVVFFEVVETK